MDKKIKQYFLSIENIKTGERRDAVTGIRSISKLHSSFAAYGWIINGYHEK